MRRYRPSVAAAIAGIVALGAAAAPMPAQELGQSTGLSISKEYVQPGRTERRKKKKTVRVSGGDGKGQKWQWDRKGNARDGVGNYRSAKRLRRLILTSMVGVPNTGRQWRILQKNMRRLAPDLLNAHPLKLLQFASQIRAGAAV